METALQALQSPLVGLLPGQCGVDQWSIMYPGTLVTSPVSTWITLKGPTDTDGRKLQNQKMKTTVSGDDRGQSLTKQLKISQLLLTNITLDGIC